MDNLHKSAAKKSPEASHSGNAPESDVNRRNFMGVATGGLLAAMTSGAMTSGSVQAALTGVHNSMDDTIRVGLVGCGGRGTGAATNALNMEPRVKIVAMGDLFMDRVTNSHQSLLDGEHAERIAVTDEMKFSGFDAYEKVIQNCDVVILATTPHFRPQQIEKAVDAGVHIFAEKPVATDAPGVARVRAACEKAREKGLTVVSGLCYRYQKSKQETIDRIHDGSVGDIVNLECTYNTGELWYNGRKDDWTDMEYQIRNWYYYNWLSGDHIAEQSIHSLDKIMWAMKDVPPVKCTASGGRARRTEEKWGDIWDHFNCVFEWESGVKLYSSCRQWSGADGKFSDYVYGTRGTAAIQAHKIDGEVSWRYKGSGEDLDMYDSEWNELFRSLKGERDLINDGEYMCNSTLLAILGRTAAYTGKTLTWDQMKDSTMDLSPSVYEFGSAPLVEIPKPGTTKFS